MVSRITALFCLGALCASPALAEEPAKAPYAKFLYPLAAPIRSPKITVNTEEVPDLKVWGDDAVVLAREWFPVICQFLSTSGYQPPRDLKITIRRTLQVPAYTAGPEISISGAWVRQHPDDFGMVIHELTHVIQAYPQNPGNPGWLVEGIADYIRFWRYEADVPRPRIDAKAAGYRGGYRVTGAFLAWASAKYDRRLVARLDGALRAGKYSDALFDEITGKPLDTLWSEFSGYQAPAKP